MNKAFPRIKLPARVTQGITSAWDKVRWSITPGIAAGLVLLIFFLAS